MKMYVTFEEEGREGGKQEWKEGERATMAILILHGRNNRGANITLLGREFPVPGCQPGLQQSMRK